MEDSEGFLYPKVDESICVNCGLCEKVCPVLNHFDNLKPTKVFAAINPDDAVRKSSSSGGVFSLLAEQIIAKGGVVFGARFDEDWQVKIVAAETIEDTVPFRGSKYVQARTEDSYIQCKEILEKGRDVLYCGTPCQVAGLLHYLRKPYANLLTVDFICHGVPSPLVWKRYLEEVLTAGKKAMHDVQYRNKRKGWRRFSFRLDYDQQEKEVTLSSDAQANPFMKAFLSNLILRPSCHTCPAKNGTSNSDITIADFWGIQNVCPSMNDDRGTSLIIVNTEKGFNILPLIEIKHVEVPIDSLRFNPSYSKSSIPHSRRSEFFGAFNNTNNLHRLIDCSLRPPFRQRLAKIKYPLHCMKKYILNMLHSENVPKYIDEGADSQFVICSSATRSALLKDVNFRDKRNGWKSYSILFTLKLDE